MTMDLSRRELLIGAAGALSTRFCPSSVPQISIRPLPSPAQLRWQRDELALFLHFGVNTFTDREWGDGTESPAIFNPARLDARQWARSARAAGARALILTAKHHDGFCLWPSRLTSHSVASSPWRGGNGDLVREFTGACRREGLRAGLYLSPWDRNASAYGDSPRYNDFYCDQLTELLTRYGPIAEVWFDGANGEGPNGRRQEYDWPRIWSLVRRLQPGAVIFSDAGPDVRWCGNEDGSAGDPNWSTVDPAKVAFPGATGDGVIPALQHGDADGSTWRPAEADTSIRPGWFYHPAEDGRVKTAEQLTEIWFKSVGRNSKLLLNVPPTRDGLLHNVDIANLLGMHRTVERLFAHDFAAGRRTRWATVGARTIGELDLGRTVMIGMARLEEDIARGQAVARYAIQGLVDGAWRELTRGTTIGYRKLDRFAPERVRQLRIIIEEAVAPPRPLRIGLYTGT